jgi:large subunit ribosomal protein L29
MPILRVKEIRDMSSDQRMEKLDEFKTELVRLKTMVKAGGTVENPARIRELRRTIARILTIENEQKLGLNKEKKEEKKKK